VKLSDDLQSKADSWQRRHRPAAVTYGVIKKFGGDDAHLYVVSLGWYGFVAIYPLLLAVVTVFAFIGAGSLGHQLTTTLHEFPVVGSQFNPAHGSPRLRGSAFGLVIGVAGMVYGAQGVTQTVQQAMVKIWNLPKTEVPGFLPRLVRSLTGLAIIGGTFAVNAALSTFTTGNNVNPLLRIPELLGMVVVNSVLYVAAFRSLTPSTIPTRSLVPGAALAAFGFTFLITLGSGLVQHQLKNSSATYGQFGVVIGLVAFLFLLGTISLYGAELNPVLARTLWPRALQSSHPTEVDRRILTELPSQGLVSSDPGDRAALCSDTGEPGERNAADRDAATART
jgi:uncharacterized BrkB/YihY/UPF0761 family membrane protein